MMKKVVLSIFLSLLIHISYSIDHNQIDSLENLLENLVDNQRVDMLNNLSYLYRGIASGKIIEYGKQALELSEDLSYKHGEANALKNIGQGYFFLGDYDNSINYFFRSLKIMEESEDEKGIAECFRSLGNVYLEVKKHDDALEYYHKSLAIKKKIGDEKSIAATLNNIGVVYLVLGKNDKALEYHWESLHLKEKIGDLIGISYSLNNIGFAYFNENNLGKALEYYYRSLNIRRDIGNKKEIAVSLFNIGETYVKLNNFSKAVYYLEKAHVLAKETDTKTLIKNIYNAYTELYNLTKDYKKAFEYQVLLSEIKDSIYNKESNRQIAKMQTIYETEKKEKEIELLNKEKQIQNSKFATQRIIVFSVICFSVLILIIVFVLYNRFRLKKKANILLSEQNSRIIQQKEEIQTQAEELAKHRNQLENLVEIRTAELKIAKEKAEESDKLKTAFLANMSHEIRTPMNAIIGFSNLLIDPEVEEEQKEGFIKILTNNSNALLQIIDDIIDIARIDSDQLIIHKTDFVLNKMISDLFDKFLDKRDLRDKQNIDFKLVLKNQDINFKVYSDQFRIEQILSNLINNALKFTEKGSVEFGYDFDDQIDQSSVRFFVKDTGIGMSKEQQKNIFKRFTKIETDIKKLYRGAGLGLAISKGLVDLLGGKIWLKSKINNGTEFYFTIPCDKILEKEKLVNEKLNFITNYNWPDKTILIAEDEDSSFMYLKLLLAKTKVKILRVGNGKDAVDICQKNKIDLILMDIKMPEMDGVEATSIIKKQLPDIPVIVQSAYSASADFMSATRSIFNDIVEKPISGKNILTIISKYL